MSTLQTTNLKNPSSGSNNIVLDANGRVGIGTPTPSQPLHVAGNIFSGSSVSVEASTASIYTSSPGVTTFRHTTDSSGALLSVDGAWPIRFSTNSAVRYQIASDGSFSSVVPGGSTLYPQFECRAWVNFNGTGTVAIRASGNVSSITDNGVGDYTVNFTTAMVDANYAAVTAGSGEISGGANPRQGPSTSDTRAASSIRMRTGLDTTVLADWYAIDLAIFR